MGLSCDDDVIVDDGVGGSCGGKSFGLVSCSICLEAVTDNGNRSLAKLQCGHEFHLDCIGSAFNIKGAMQCPNCRKIEKGQWLYANGSRTVPEFSMNDWTHDEDLYDLGYSEMSFGVHWCPFGSLTRFPSSLEEAEFSSTAYHDLLGQQAIYAEHTGVSSATNPCPYIAYFGPIHPSSSNSSGSVSDGSNFNNHWNGPSIPGDMQSSYAFPSMDLHYHSWEHHSPSFSSSGSRINGADPPSIPPVTQRSTRIGSDLPRSGSFMHPFIVGHSSAARAGSSVASSMVPHYQGSNARSRDRMQALQVYHQQQHPGNSSGTRAPIISGTRRSSSHRGSSQLGPVASSSDQSRGGFYFIPGSGRNFQEAENPVPAHFHAWERDRLPSFPQNQFDRDPSFREFYQAVVGPEPGIRSGSLRQRHGRERSSSQNRS